MSNHQKKADNHQRKADISAEFVRPLLKRLKLAKERVLENSEMEKFINEISPEVVKTKDLLNCRENLDRDLVAYLGKIERQIDSLIDQKPRKKASELCKKDTTIEVGESSNTIYQMDVELSKVQEFKDLLESLDTWGRYLVKILGTFPENTELKKRLLINWWGLFYAFGYVEAVFSILIDKKVLIPVHREHNKAIDRFTIEPTFHKWLISNSERGDGVIHSEKREEGTWRSLDRMPSYSPGHSQILLNLDQKYLNSKDLMDISSRYDDLKVVQLGSWRCTETEVHNRFEETESEETKSKDHIEVDQTDFLKKLGKNVWYFSLRGISGITELPESIGKLEDLRILDLRACHNLEKLPQKPKPRSSLQKIIRCSFFEESMWWFNSLEVLDISECYLLDYTPKWVCGLHCLEVLKGFVVGSLGNKNQSCQLGDLSKIPYLRKLSIRFTNDILSPDVFEGFDYLERLEVLTITWAENKHKEIPAYSLPNYLEKLDMRRYPEADVSKWENLEELKWLKRLYIRGGNLTNIPSHNNWEVEILRLRYLKKLVHPTSWEELRMSFENLKYVEYVECSKPINFPNKDGSTWHNEE